jgi:hypothetical protein
MVLGSAPAQMPNLSRPVHCSLFHHSVQRSVCSDKPAAMARYTPSTTKAPIEGRRTPLSTCLGYMSGVRHTNPGPPTDRPLLLRTMPTETPPHPKPTAAISGRASGVGVFVICVTRNRFPLASLHDCGAQVRFAARHDLIVDAVGNQPPTSPNHRESICAIQHVRRC